MKDLMIKQESFVSDNIQVRLKNLAKHIERIGTQVLDGTKSSTAELIRESMYFIEWTAPQMEIDLACELVELGRTLARWLYKWETIWSDSFARIEVSQEAKSLSLIVLNMSRLLDGSVN